MFRGSQLLGNASSPYISSSFAALLISFHLLLWPPQCSNYIRLWILCVFHCHRQDILSPCISLKASPETWHFGSFRRRCALAGGAACWPHPSLFAPCSFPDCSCWRAHLKGAQPDLEFTPAWFSASKNKLSAHILLLYRLFLHSCKTVGFDIQSGAKHPPPALISWPLHA